MSVGISHKRAVSVRDLLSGKDARVTHLLSISIIAILIFAANAPGIGGALMRSDDLLNIDFVKRHGPLSGFFDTNTNDLWYGEHYYRPFFIVQTWVTYELSGLQHAGYQIMTLAQQLIACALLYYVCIRLELPAWISLMAALIFAVHRFSEIVLWVTDSGPLSGVFLALLILVLLKPLSRKSFLAIFALLLVLFLNRENNVPIAAVVGAYLLFGAWKLKLYSWNQVITGIGVIAAAGVVYFLMRWQALGTFFVPAGFGYRTGFFTEVIWDSGALEPLKRIVVYTYNVIASQVVVFFPIFGSEGGLAWLDVLQLAYGAILLMPLVVALYPLYKSQTAGTSGTPVSISARKLTLAFLGTILLTAITYLIAPIDPGASVFALVQSLLSVLILYSLLRHYTELSARLQAIVFFAVILIVASSLPTFVYFRYRSLYLSLFAWLLLLAISMNTFRVLERRRQLHTVMAVLTLVLILISSVIRFDNLPVYRYGMNRLDTGLCHKGVPIDFALEIADLYDVKTEQMDCRDDLPPDR